MLKNIILAAAASLTLASSDPTCSGIADPDKVDCGIVGSTQSTCEAKGCCWKPAAAGSSAPWCFYKKGNSPTCPLAYNSTSAPFSDSEVATMRAYFLKNINVDGSGAVVAAPDYNTPGGSYYYHWERDGALSMSALLHTASNVDEVRTEMDAYVGWVSRVQQEVDPHGQSVLAEPKYMIPNGTVYAGGWCRPQNDGPGLRSKTLLAYANALMEEEEMDVSGKKTKSKSRSTYTSDDLWALIQIDLDWQAVNWSANGCDLWEEIRSNDFFWNRYTMRAALTDGAKFATAKGDATRSTTYTNAANEVEADLASHFQSGFVQECDERKKDAAVICAFNDGYLNDGIFGPTSVEVAGTIKTLNELFCDSFTINQLDTKNGIPGILYGRYEGDHYAGGNPWILLSSALAELLYRGATEMVAHANGKVDLKDDGLSLWSEILNLPFNYGENVDSLKMASAFAGAGDGVLTRIRSHVSSGDFHLTEQINRETGATMAAHDLTWSYAATLKAIRARAQYMDALSLKQ